MIEIEGLTVDYASYRALDRINLRVADGEFALLAGPSGCGKSTLARCLNGLLPQAIPAAVNGRIIVDGKDVAAHTVAEMATSVGLVFQNPATQLFNLTVEEEVACGPRNVGLVGAALHARVDWALVAAGIAHLRGRSIRTLSGGEGQRVAIAAVLAMGPRLLVLDEPLAALDGDGARTVLSTLARLNAEHGITVLMVEHRLGQAARYAGRTLLMDQGRLVAGGASAEIFSRPDLLLGLGLRCPSEPAPKDWAALIVPHGCATGVPIVELRDVDAGYGPHTVLHGLNLTLHAGEFAALVGDSGAGKSTLARLLAGLLRPRCGEVRVGRRRSTVPGRDVALLLQNPLEQLFCDTVEEEVAFGPRNFGRYDPAALAPLWAATGLAGLRGRPVGMLSSGQQQRTALAAILSLRPGLVILDEPTMGQDWRHLSGFMDFLVRLNQAGATILLITHDYELVRCYARRVLLLREGRIVADGKPARRGEFAAQVDSSCVIRHF